MHRILFTLHGMVVTVHAAVVAGAFALANTAALVFSATVQDINPTAIVAGFTMITVALAASIKMITPPLIEAIKSVGLALSELQKQREDIRKGTLTDQLEKMNQKLKDMESAAEMVAKTHAMEAQNNARSHAIELQGMRVDMDSARVELARLREENLRLTHQVAQRAEAAITQSAINADNLKVMIRDSGTFVAVPPVSMMSMDDLLAEPLPGLVVPAQGDDPSSSGDAVGPAAKEPGKNSIPASRTGAGGASPPVGGQDSR